MDPESGLSQRKDLWLRNLFLTASHEGLSRRERQVPFDATTNLQSRGSDDTQIKGVVAQYF